MFIHPVTRLIHTDSKTTAHFLTLVCGRISTMFQGAYLEDIWIIPSFPQGRVRENKPHRIIQRKQLFLIFQDQFIGRLIITDVCALLQTGICFMPFLINAEISGMCRMHIDAAQILLIRRIEQRQIFIQNRCVFLFKDLTIFRIHFVSISIVFTIILHLINKEKRKRLDASVI